jgi:hypothetical protein
MIILLGSRYDPVSTGLVERWPGAVLCGAEELTMAGWVWPLDSPTERRWVVDGGRVVPDVEVTGVFLRRGEVHPDELTGTHPDDRRYLASEAKAFLVYVLATTAATVANPVHAGGWGDETLGLERVLAEAAALDVEVAPLHLVHPSSERPQHAAVIEVAGKDTFGDGRRTLHGGAAAVANALGLIWATVAFDDDGRITGMTTRIAPSGPAAAALGHLLGQP